MTTTLRRGFTTAEVVLASSAMLLALPLLLPVLLSAFGALPRPAASGGRDGSAVATRMEAVRQQVEHFRMRLIDADDRRCNHSIPFE